MKVKGIPLVIGALETATKCLKERLEELEIRAGIETILITALMRPKVTCCYSDPNE